MKFVDITGNKYGRLTVLQRIRKHPKKTHWLCQCECGNKTVTEGYYLKTGHTASCGCQRSISAINTKTIHGYHDTPTYRTWRAMLNRCNLHSQQNYYLYGGRGIRVCDRWRKFEKFLADMGEKPKGMTIDRVDNDGNYESGNCQWATPKQQSNNSRHNRVVSLFGRRQNLQQWLDELNIPKSTVYSRLYRGTHSTYESAILASLQNQQSNHKKGETEP